MTTNTPLSTEESEAIVVAAQSVFTKLRNLYRQIEPIFVKYGFTAPSAGVVARDLSEKIEVAITQHCSAFSKGIGHCDLLRSGENWEVKICQGGGLTINQSKTVAGENYIVVNYSGETKVTALWILWNAQDAFFSPKKPNTNARSLVKGVAGSNIEVLFQSQPAHAFHAKPELPMASGKPAKAVLRQSLKKQVS